MATQASAQATPERWLKVDRSSRWYVVSLLLRHKLALMGGFLLLLVLFAAVFAPLLATHDPMYAIPADRLLAPGTRGHHLGTDNFGRDIYSRVLYGARLSLQVGGSVVLFATLLGGLIGLGAGYFRKWDNFLMRIMDGMMAFPGVLLATAIMASLGAAVSNVIAALSVVYMPRLARVVRSQVLVVREQVYVEAAEAQGASHALIIFRHILPNCLSPVIIQSTVIFAYAILTEAALSFLGVGAPPDIPSWGNILSEGRDYMTQASWMTTYAGLAIMVTVLGLNLFGDALRDVLDPRSEQ
jgi:peptide/nickel transport system permease protein